MSSTDREPGAEGDLATSTLAEIYAQQGLYERALAIYERIALRAPQDEAIAMRIAALKDRIENAPGAEDAAAGKGAAPNPAVEPVSPSPAAAPPLTEPAGPTHSEEGRGSRDDQFQAWLNSR